MLVAKIIRDKIIIILYYFLMVCDVWSISEQI